MLYRLDQRNNSIHDCLMKPTLIDPRDYQSPFAAFLQNPEEYKRKRFAEAAAYVREGLTMHVACNGVWSASKPNKSVQSYEKLGYHSGAEWLLQGFLLSGGKVIFHNFRNIDGEVTL